MRATSLYTREAFAGLPIYVSIIPFYKFYNRSVIGQAMGVEPSLEGSEAAER